MAAMTLVSILDEDENKVRSKTPFWNLCACTPQLKRFRVCVLVCVQQLIMLQNGSLPRLVALMRSKDFALRKCGVDCMQRITRLGDISPAPLHEFEQVPLCPGTGPPLLRLLSLSAPGVCM